MKKKTVRKVSLSKKPTSKAHKSKQSLFGHFKYWLLCVVLLVVGIAYYFSQSQPKPVQVLEVSGTVEDYLTPKPLDINIITGKTLPKSEDPEVNAYIAAKQAKETAVKADKSDEEVEEIVERAAKKAALETYQSLAAVGQLNSASGLSITQTADGSNITKPADLYDQVDKAVNDVTETITTFVKNNVIVTKDEKTDNVTTTVVPLSPSGTQKIDPNVKCQTKAGFSVSGGERMIGNVVEGKDEVMTCTANGWQSANCFYDKNNPAACPVTVAPSYLNSTEGKNCENNGQVIGNGSTFDDGGNRKVCVSGELKDAFVYNGQTYTPDTEQIAKERCESSPSNGTWDNTLKICGASPTNCTNGGGTWVDGKCDMSQGTAANFTKAQEAQAAIKKAQDECEGRNRANNGKTYEVVNNACVLRQECRAQGVTAVCKIYNSEGQVVSNTITTVDSETGKTETTDVSSVQRGDSSVSLSDSNRAIVNPGGKLGGGWTTEDPKNCIYGAEEIEKSDGKYKCKDQTGTVPRTLTAINYGSNNQELNSSITSITDNTNVNPVETNTTNDTTNVNYQTRKNGETCPHSLNCRTTCPGGKYSINSSGIYACDNTVSNVQDLATAQPYKECVDGLSSGQKCVRVPGTTSKDDKWISTSSINPDIKCTRTAGDWVLSIVSFGLASNTSGECIY